MITHITDSLISVKVPDEAQYLDLTHHKDGIIFQLEKWEQIDFPPGRWEILGIANEVSEKVAKEFVESAMHYMVTSIQDSRCAYDYFYNYEQDERSEFYEATESLLSLVRSKGGSDNDLLIRRVV